MHTQSTFKYIRNEEESRLSGWVVEVEVKGTINFCLFVTSIYQIIVEGTSNIDRFCCQGKVTRD